MSVPLLRLHARLLRMLRAMRWQLRSKHPGTVLVAMRLEDMRVVHPSQDNTHSCARCRHIVGIYPSGQAALKRWPKMKIWCARCAKPTELDIGIPAAQSREEYLAEKRDSKPRC